MRIAALSGWTREQKHVVAASFLGWALDAFDYFLLVFVLKDIAQEFQTEITDVTLAILLTLAMRPIGAFLFGRAADRWGRRPVLMAGIAAHYGNDYAFALAIVAGIVAIVIAILTAFGPEARGVAFGGARAAITARAQAHSVG